MFYKFLSTILFFSRIIASECPEGFVSISDSCYYKSHLDVLQDFIDMNESLDDMDPQKIGTQAWRSGKLTYLYLGDHLLTTLPDSIGLLTSLTYLDVRNNQITTIPDEICILYPHAMDVNLKQNNICPPYPHCFNYVGHQNKELCESFQCPVGYVNINDECYNEKHVSVLNSFIKINESLMGLNALDLGSEIGYQGWENGELIILNLMNNELTNIPEEFCTIINDVKLFDLTNNNICPPYPSCIDYLGYQNTLDCQTLSIQGPFSEEMIDNHTILSQLTNESSTFNIGNFYHDLSVLQDIIDENSSLKGKHPLEIGRQQWTDMRLVSLNLSDRGLTSIPASICNIHENLNNFDISNNFIIGEYPICMQERANKAVACRDGYNLFDDQCYYYKDMSVLIDFIKENPSLENLHPLMLGYQAWENNRLELLYLVGLDITSIPPSIRDLDKLQYLDINSNILQTLPEAICEIYPQLISIDLTNNYLTPPYLSCIDYMGWQNVSNVNNDECPIGHEQWGNQCYYQQDIEVLRNFIDENNTLKDLDPLEIGIQKWKNMRLDLLYLGENGLTKIPESICEIHENLSSINIGKNKICPPYPSCMEQMNDQDTSNCP